MSDIRYRAVPDDFFERRRLRRYAGTWSLLAFGVGAVIAGEYTGWNPGLIYGGFGGLLVATLIVTVMYVALCSSLAEMAAAMPFAGTAYAYTRVALGAWGGFLAGLTQAVAALLGSAVFVTQIADTVAPAADRAFGISLPEPVWWALLYGVFGWVNIYGVALYFRVAATLCFAALAVLVLFWMEALPRFEMHMALNVETTSNTTLWLPNGLPGVAWALPFAIWFYINIEQTPLAAEEAKQPTRSLPRALLYGVLILIIAAFFTLVANSGGAPGATAVGQAKDALLVAFQNILVYELPYLLLPFLYLIGLVASFHTSIYAFSRSIYVLARAGYLPTELALTHPKRQTPLYAILVGTAFAYVVALVIELSPGNSHIASLLLNMAVFSALICYVFIMVAYVVLARDHPDMERPFVSPLGATGAITAMLIAIAAVVLLFHNHIYRPGLYGTGAILLGGIIYFVLRRRHRLVRSPEEAFALELERRSQATAADAATATSGA